MSIRSIPELLKAAFFDWLEHKAYRLAAAMAYYAVVSLAPLLIIVIALVALIYGQAAAEGHIATQIEGLVGLAARRPFKRLSLTRTAPRPASSPPCSPSPLSIND